jgi:LysM repeat protein
MLVAAAVVATTVDGQVGPRGSPVEPTATAKPGLSALPTPANPTATALTITTLLAVAAVTSATPIQASTITPLPFRASAGSPTLRSSVTTSSSPSALPLARASLTVPAALPAPVSPEGPIVAAYTTYSTYTVQPGDTLNRIATEFGASGDIIVRTSNIGNPNLLVPGQVLTIPRDSGWLYRVQPNDTLDLVAVRFGVSLDDLIQASGLASPVVRPGDLLFIPNKALPIEKQ